MCVCVCPCARVGSDEKDVEQNAAVLAVVVVIFHHKQCFTVLLILCYTSVDLVAVSRYSAHVRCECFISILLHYIIKQNNKHTLHYITLHHKKTDFTLHHKTK